MRTISVLLLVATVSTAEAQTGTRYVWAPLPGYSCAKWINTAEEYQDEHRRLSAWATGFLSGSNWRAGTDFIRGRDANVLWAWIDDYCRRNPQHTFVNAVAALENELRSARADDQTKAQTKPDWREVIREAATLPPVEYDHPFEGSVATHEVPDLDLVQKLCQTDPERMWAVACAFRSGKYCVVIRLHKDTLKDFVKVDPDIIFRHEIGHCNGWPKDHPGARQLSRKQGEK